MVDFEGNAPTLGVLWILYAVLRVLGGIWMILYSGTLTVMWGALLSRVPDPFYWMSAFHAFLFVAIGMAFLTALLALVAGLALLSRSDSARVVAIVAAIFGLLSGPLGIALGAYTLAVMVPAGDRGAGTRLRSAA
jgi:hypothetical protein